MRILVIGGYGNFGARICRRLASHSDAEVVATERRARALAQGVRYARLDLDAESFAADLRALQPELVIHCAGPFQGQDYRVARAAAAAGAHYLDLADGREFVTQFARAVDPAMRAAGCLAVSGASTLPALSAAVLDAGSAGFRSSSSRFACDAQQTARARSPRCPQAFTNASERGSRWACPSSWRWS
jgi:saccharopine dehydrogenase-like NADP-dependent oxidoreductase